MQLNEYIQPEYLFCEIQPKDGTFNDHRIWIYHRLSLSLIEFVCLNDIDVDGINEGTEFTYGLESWRGIFVQNNTELAGRTEKEVMSGAWTYLKTYLEWEDNNLDEDERANYN